MIVLQLLHHHLLIHLRQLLQNILENQNLHGTMLRYLHRQEKDLQIFVVQHYFFLHLMPYSILFGLVKKKSTRLVT